MTHPRVRRVRAIDPAGPAGPPTTAPGGAGDGRRIRAGVDERWPTHRPRRIPAPRHL